MPIEWAAVSALGTIAAAIIPGWAYFGERRERRRAEAESRELRVERELKEIRDRREQIADEVRRVRLYSNANVMGRKSTVIRVVNDSDHPITGLFVGLELLPDTTNSLRETSRFRSIGGAPHPMEPGQSITVESSITDVAVIAWLCFHDVRGRVWSRDLVGRVQTWYPPGFEVESYGELFSSGMGSELPMSEEAEKRQHVKGDGRGLFT